jgi:hypothetical protein
MADLAFSLGLSGLVWVMVWATAGLTLASLGAYLYAWIGHMSAYETAGRGPEW